MIDQGRGSFRLRAGTGMVSMALALVASPAAAQTAGDPTFQNFFGATVCNSPAPGSAFLARCLETFDSSQPAGQQFANISAASESSLRPSQAAVNASNALNSAKAVASLTEARLEELRDDEQGNPVAGTGKIAGFGPWSVFTSFTGEWLDQSRPAFANERGFNGHQYGGTLGADYRVSESGRVGLLVSYSKLSLGFDAEPASASFVPSDSAGGSKAETITASAFFLTNLTDSVWLDGAVGYNWSNHEFRRNAIFQPATLATSLNVNTRGTPNGRGWFASAGMGYDFTDGGLSVGPYIRGQYVHAEVDAYAENDLGATGLAFDVSKQEANSLLGTLGVRASYAIGTSWGVIIPQTRFEYEHEFEDDARTVLTQFAQDPNNVSFFVTTDQPDRDHFNAGLSLALVLPNGVMPYVDYEALLGYSNFTRHRLTAGLRLEF